MRKLAGMMLMVLFALLIAACGDDEDSDATEEATTVSAVTTEVADETATAEEATEEATEEPAGAGTASTPVTAASPVGAMATPAAATLPVTSASPVSMASPAASTVATPVGAATPETAAAAVPPVGGDAGAGEMVTLSGEVTLPGTAGETFVLADDGCVGLNGYSDLRAGRQLVVRDETGTIIGVTEIAASDSTDACSWTFSLEVPEAEFYAVSVPMEVEHVFPRDEVEASGGEITVPLR